MQSSTKRVLLYDLGLPALIVEDADGITYQNQVGGVVCWQAELVGVLCPIDVADAAVTELERLPYTGGRMGVSSELADRIDAILASSGATRFVTVDRARLDESWEAWVYVRIDATAPHGNLVGFGAVTGVLTWANSD